MNDIQPKVSTAATAGLAGSGVGGALTIVLVKNLTRIYGTAPDPEEVVAWTVIITSLCAFIGTVIGGYLRREKILPAEEKGFTLIELLVVIGILGIMASVAIPQFNIYRQRATDARTRADLKNAVLAEEAYFAADGRGYTGELDDLIKAGYRRSPGVEIRIQATSSDFEIKAWASSGCAEGTGWWQYATKGAITGLECR